MNCKPGDLAIVISATETPEMIGSIVKVIRPSINGDVEKINGRLYENRLTQPTWRCEAISSMGIATRLPPYGELVYLSHREINDCLLRPVSGIPDTEQTDEREPIKDVA